jgi:hypothetical protein
MMCGDPVEVKTCCGEGACDAQISDSCDLFDGACRPGAGTAKLATAD